MAELKPERLAAQLAAEPLRPAYLIAGPEALIVLEAADAVRAAAREAGITEREVFDIEGKDPDWDSVAAAFNAPGLFATRRVVEVRMPGGKPGKDGAEILNAFCANPPPDVVPARHLRRVEPGARRQVERGDRAHRPHRHRLAGEAARTDGLDRATACASAACARTAMRCSAWWNASRATCSPPRRKSTSWRCSPTAKRSTRRAWNSSCPILRGTTCSASSTRR
jgi:hypothetical protein